MTGTGRAGRAAPALTAPLRHRPFRALAAGRTLLYFGNGLATVALAFAVLDATGSVAQLGLVVGARSLANVLLLLAGGVLADRMPRGLLLCGACAVAAGSQGLLAASLLLDAASLPLMLVLAAVNGAASAANLPAAAALVPQTVPAALLRQANALARIGMEGGRIIGMSFGTLLVALIGASGAIAADGAAFALAGVCFTAVRAVSPRRPSGPPADPLRELAEGWAEFTRRRWVWLVVVQFMVVNAAMSATVSVLGPAIADASFGRTAWGLLLTVNSLGMLLGGLLAARWQPRRALCYGVALIAVDAVPLLVLGLSPVLPVLFAAMFLAGMAVEQFTVAWEVSLQQNVPQERLARVYSYDALGSFLAMPLGQVAVGPVAEAAGAGPALVGAAALMLAATGVALTDRGLRTLRRVDGPAPAA
ncbi:MFS transporter [Nocardiopsis potens]|uniref:MFS transporter n=1 Tax=Nocardiopsis potens TaxID=1246458 RepID=UPI000344F59B|nr:MFS transporter [Nocardiopsis potens]